MQTQSISLTQTWIVCHLDNLSFTYIGAIKNHASIQTQTKQNLVGIIQDSGSKLLQNIESNTRRL